jgi:hypothetical protein
MCVKSGKAVLPRSFIGPPQKLGKISLTAFGTASTTIGRRRKKNDLLVKPITRQQRNIKSETTDSDHEKLCA